MRVGAKIVAWCWLIVSFVSVYTMIVWSRNASELLPGLLLAIIPMAASMGVLLNSLLAMWTLAAYSFVSIAYTLVLLWNIYVSKPVLDSMHPFPEDLKKNYFLPAVITILMLTGLIVLLLSSRKMGNSTDQPA